MMGLCTTLSSMKVKIDGWCWLDATALTDQQVANIRTALTLKPKRTSEHQSADPDPIELYHEDKRNGLLGVPREWYRENITKKHEEEILVSDGQPMSDFKSLMTFDDPKYREQPVAVEAMMRYAEDRLPGYGGWILKGDCGFGKALRHGEPVIAENGEVPVEKIKVGDRVFGVDGRLHNVTGVFPQGRRQIYRIRFTDGSHSDCDEDHLWTFELRRRRGKKVTLSLRELLKEPLKEKSGRRFYLPSIEPIRFDSGESLPIEPYTLGVLLGDGSMSSEGSSYALLTTMDFEIIGSLDRPARHTSGITWIVDGTKEPLQKLGLWGRSSHNKFIPDVYLKSSPQERLEMLQGLFDTDGSFVPGNCVEYSTTSESLARGVQWLVWSLGGTAKCSERVTTYPYDGEVREGRLSYRVSVKLPDGMDPFRILRKKSKLRKDRQRGPYRAVDSIEKLCVDLATCIRVDAPGNLFLTRGMIPTHNTNTAMEFARKHGRSTVVLVHKEFFINQWRRRFELFFPGAKVGLIRQNLCQFEGYDFVIAMIQSLASKGTSYPSEMYDAFGLVISDEVHRVGAPSWAPVIPRFSARYRLGLTATDRRKDGCEDVFRHHIGQIAYAAKTKSLIPQIRRIYTDTVMRGKMKPGGKIKKASEMGRSEVVSQLAGSTARTRQVMEDVVNAVKMGRKVMVLSERIVHLKELADDLNILMNHAKTDFPVVCDFYTGSWYTGELDGEGNLAKDKNGDPKTKRRTEEQLEKAESANVIFATVQMVQEGLDIQAIDVLVVATPIGDVEQAAGRVRRPCLPIAKKCEKMCPWRAGVCASKPDPIIVEVIDEDVPQAMSRWKARARFYRSIGAM